MGTSFVCRDFLDRLGGQALVMIGQWYSRQPLTNHKERLSTDLIPEIVAPKAFTHSRYSFWSGESGTVPIWKWWRRVIETSINIILSLSFTFSSFCLFLVVVLVFSLSPVSLWNTILCKPQRVSWVFWADRILCQTPHSLQTRQQASFPTETDW